MPAEPRPHTLIVHYHEISLKRGNRPVFLRRLQDNLLRAVGDLGSAGVEQLPGRIVLSLDGALDAEAIAARIGRVFGVANFALAERTLPDLDALKRAVDRVTEGRRFA